MIDSCEIYEYSIDKLLELFSEYSKASPREISAKLHSQYFQDYFEYIGAKTIIVEKKYVDKDYLEDYAEYYVRCFNEYERKCVRLHFFKIEFSSDDFLNCLLGLNDSLQQSIQAEDDYLSFIVLKPLPRTIIGRTCLRTYPHEERRYFPATRCYTANLFGLNLKVHSSLAFQEQDSVVAACATSALWSIFQATGQMFQHTIPSPSAITNQATAILSKEQRTFPSSGLTSIEMAHAIKGVGLEPYIVDVTKHYVLKATLYAYLRAGIPMMLGFYLVDINEPQKKDKHAVAITGYSLGHMRATYLDGTDFLLTATKIDKIYVHDDQVGPFSRMEFDKKLIKLPDREPELSISTSWKDKYGNIGGKRAISDILLIPLYHKIRIPFGVIEDIIIGFDTLLKFVIPEIMPELKSILQYLEWDIYLIPVNVLKQEILNSYELKPEIRKNILIKSFPRFLWRASLMVDKNIKFDFLFDATDIEQGNFLLHAIEYDIELTEKFSNIFCINELEDGFGSLPAWSIVNWFKSNMMR